MGSSYAYLTADLIFLLVWALFFWRAKFLRREMLVMSFIAAIFGPLSEFWYFKDYWQPELLIKFPVGGLEDILFGFAIGGIAAVAYEAIFINRICLCERKKLKKEWFLLVFAIILGVAMIGLNNLFGINSIYASSLGMIIAGVIILYFRRDLILNALGSGILLFGHVPLTEMIWGLSWGFVWGPIYEFIIGARTLRLKRQKI